MFGSEAFGASPWRSARPVPEVATAEVSAAVAAVQSSNRSIVVRQPRVHAQADGEEAGALLGAMPFLWNFDGQFTPALTPVHV